MKNTIKKLGLLFIVLIMTAVLSVAVNAVEYTDGYYTYTVDDGEATIVDVDAVISGDVIVPATLGGYDVTKIGEYAFEWCDKITSITLPECLVEIGDYAFVDCRYLTAFFIVGNDLVDTCALETIGDSAFLRCMILESVDIPDSVTYLGEYAFAGCYEITDVKIGAGVTELKFCLFDWCQKITSVDIGDNVERIEDCAFNTCTGLKSVRIGANASYIDVSAFNSCTGLEYIEVSADNDNYITLDGALYKTLQDSNESNRKPHTLIRLTKNAIADNTYVIPKDLYWIEPTSTVEVGKIDFDTSLNCGHFYKANNALMHCENYIGVMTGISMVKYLGNAKYYTIPTDVNNILYLCFSGAEFEKVIVPEGITSLPSSCFFKCSNLKEIVLPNSLTQIGSGCFHSCTSLESIVIPDGVKDIPGFLFCDCTSLKYVELPKYLKSIDEYAFNNTAIEEMVIPKTTKTIKAYAFSHLTKKITIKADLDELSDFVFYECRDLETIIFEGSIGKIGKSAFENCGNLKTINLPSTVEEIDKAAFMYCWSLENIVLPSGITKIAENTFKNCSALTTITIPAGVTEVEKEAFMNVNNLKYIYFGGTQDQWNNITIGRNNDALYKATIIFADGIKCMHFAVDNRAQVDATCINTGMTAGVYCNDCKTWIEGGAEIGKTDHNDADADGKCDVCSKDLTEGCTCRCHKNNFIWKILRFFYKLFRINPKCSCGMAHY